jgi:hypothetical protein
MHESLTRQCRQQIAKDCLVPGDPRGVRRIVLLDRLVIDHRSDLFHQRRLDTSQKIVELRSLYCR